jgi:hypothetical protein
MADGVVAGIGIQPNVELAQAAGLEVDNGIRVDAVRRPLTLPDRPSHYQTRAETIHNSQFCRNR